jgi:hypothetical protein
MTEELAPVEIARIEITRTLDSDGSDSVWVSSTDENGETLPLVIALGMLRLAEDTVMRICAGEFDDEDPDPSEESDTADD